jgi:UDP-3-O-[3-hydroxymyristoyl] N-acetylglucosamine deacetylase
MSALAGMRIDNAEVRINGPELPILDGSCQPWVSMIQSSGTVNLDADLQPLELRETVALQDGSSWIVAVPANRFSVTCVTHFDHPMLGTTSGTFVDDPTEYASGIAPSRTFAFIHEVEALREAGLALGGTLDNALVIYEDRFSTPLRVPDEWLRHKVLDLYGDLALAGGLVNAAITAIMPGHRINAKFAGYLAEMGSRNPSAR